MQLAELIRRTKGDRSYDQLARDCGGAPSAQRLQQIATNKPLKAFPDAETILSLARGLGVPVRTVVLASADSLGLPVSGEGALAELLPPAADRLNDQQVAAVLAVVNAMNPPTPAPAPAPEQERPDTAETEQGESDAAPRTAPGSGSTPRRGPRTGPAPSTRQRTGTSGRTGTH